MAFVPQKDKIDATMMVIRLAPIIQDFLHRLTLS
jgi:hypothetical protein